MNLNFNQSKAKVMATKSVAPLASVVMMVLVVSGCAQSPKQLEVNPHRLMTDERVYTEDDADVQVSGVEEFGMQRLTPLSRSRAELRHGEQLAQRFPDSDRQQVAANNLSIPEFVQLVFGEQLGVNYLLADDLPPVSPVTLNISEPVSSRRLFRLTESLLAERRLGVVEREGTFYIHGVDSASEQMTAIGIGRQYADVPDTVQHVLQVVPLRHGINISLERTLNSLSTAELNFDIQQNVIFVRGSRTQILRVIDLVNILDVPSTRGRFIGLQELVYISPEEYMTKMQELLEAEGIQSGSRGATGAALIMVPIPQIGAVAIFAGDEFVLDRAEYWAQQIDRPSRGAEMRYYIYHPRYARAQDLGQSIAPLIGGSSFAGQQGGDSTRDTQSAQGSQQRSAVISSEAEGIRMTVDERSNSILFYTQGETFQSLLPIIRRLDVMPKQIMLDATIAEVTMTDEFAQGFEFAFRSGRLTGGTTNALGVSEMGGLRLNWTDGVSNLLARLSATSSLVNVLSNPTLVVRDGVSASINVGNDIPTVGSTTTNPNFESQTTNIVYRRTGVNLTVTPTVNAQGLVVMQINQQISNTSSSGPTLAGSPSIFERTVQTEVIARSGQTILLGGLISENNSENTSSVPWVQRVPLLGRLFEGESRQREKTELVIFITPRIIEDLNEWDHIRHTISQGLTTIKIAEE